MKLNIGAFAKALAVLEGGGFFVLIFISLVTGVGKITLSRLGSFYPYFTYSWSGLFIVAVEGLICGYVCGALLAWLYNAFTK